MNKTTARKLVEETLQNSFDKEKFYRFIKELLNHFEDKPFVYKGKYIREAYAPYIQSLERIGKYQGSDGKKIDILIAKLKKESSLERARTMQRNFIAWYLTTRDPKDAALVAFVAPDSEDWRFSLVEMDYKITETPTGRPTAKEEFTPARRFSFLVGENETSHTAQSRLVPIIQDDEHNPTLEDLEEAFNIEKATKEFFEKYRDLYHRVQDTLDKVIKKDKTVQEDFETKGIDSVEFSKKLLGQIVFLYFLQKKGWFGVKRRQEWGSGSKHFLRELFDKKHGDYQNFFNDILEPLFYEALAREHTGDYYSRFDCRIPFLNGGLFDPINDYDWVDTDILLPNELFRNKTKTKEGDTGTGILDIFDRYNFTVKEDEPLEKEVAVDPEMLGKVFENLLEVKDRKSKGTYYTPREIVHYMCQESLANYLATELDGKVGKEDIDTLIKYGETVVEHDSRVVNEGRETKTYSFKLPESVRDHAKLIDEKLDSIRVCDPAVGSGAFPVGMMNEIVRTRNALTSYIGKNGERTPYHFKRHAIQECLYGVDIDPSAIEIAKLRLWLSLVVDEEDRRTIKPLPNLDYKMVCGNSLLGYPYEPGWTKEIESLKKEFFETTNPKAKQKLKSQIDSKLKGFLKNSVGSLGYKVDFDFNIFFSEVFHEKGGFDVIIANPPYISHVNYKKEDKSNLKKLYVTYSGRADLYVIFYEKGTKLLNENGTLTYISPNKFFRAGYGSKLRIFLKDNLQILSIIDFGDTPVFDATTYPAVIILKNVTIQGDYEFSYFKATSLANFNNPSHEQIFPKKYLNHQLWSFANSRCDGIWEKIKSNSVSLKAYIDNKFYRGIVTGLNEAFLIDDAQRAQILSLNPEASDIIRPYLKGRDVKRWTSKNKSYIIFAYHGIDVSKYPAVKSHLLPYKCRLEKRATSKNHKWYELQQPQTGIYSNYERVKIISTDIAKRSEFTIDYSGAYIDATIFCIPLDDLYLLALLNSNLLETYFKSLSSTIRGEFLRFKKLYMDLLPIKVTTQDEKSPIIKIVRKILAITSDEYYLSSNDMQAQVHEYEKQIDQLVYKLYDLTQEEIKIVEGETE